MEDKLFTEFVPAQAIEAPVNTMPNAHLIHKVELALRRYLSNGSYTDGEIKPENSKIFVSKCYFDSQKMGYNVIAYKA